MALAGRTPAARGALRGRPAGRPALAAPHHRGEDAPMPASLPFPDPPRMPEGVSLVAIGDVHGRLDLLEPLLARLEARAAAEAGRRHILVSLGDLVDRGPDSAGVVARLLRGVGGCETVVLRGNHEQAMLDFLAGLPGSEQWLVWGGLDTLRSYGVEADLGDIGPDTAAFLRRRLAQRLPKPHLDFLAGLPLTAVYSDYLFVHAGIRPGIALAKQSPRDLVWIRDEFHRSAERFEKKVVHGHTPVAAPQFLANRINLDTGAFATGILTAALFEDDRAEPF